MQVKEILDKVSYNQFCSNKLEILERLWIDMNDWKNEETLDFVNGTLKIIRNHRETFNQVVRDISEMECTITSSSDLEAGAK